MIYYQLLKLLEKVIPFVIDNDEGGPVRRNPSSIGSYCNL
jgi:hypothetical protein